MGPESRLEWPSTLDLAALMADGWNPIPFREFIVKVHSRCDLSCDYCYMYEMADQSWRDQPKAISPETIESTALRIGKLAQGPAEDRISFIGDGGEQHYAGRDRNKHLVTAA